MQAVGNKEVVYEFGEFVVDPNEKMLVASGTPIHLPAKEFETLLLLIENNRRALSKEEMLSAIWQDSFVEDGNLAKYISRLRKILELNGPRYIETIPKHGYRFSADLKLVAKPRHEAVVIERQTVKRLTVSVEDGIKPDLSATSSAASQHYRWPIIALVLVAGLGTTFFGFQFARTDVRAVDPYEPVRLTDSPYDDTGPSWTRDGRIRFHRIYSNDRHVTLIMNSDGSEQTEITGADGKRIFSWSPDERKVLFQKQGDSSKTYLANADGSGEVPLPFYSGSWSPDSKMLAYRAHVSGDNHDIFVYSIETGETRNVTNSEWFDADPSFSPDGKHLVFASGRDGHDAEIYSADLDGGNLRRLTFDPAIDAHPAYSPDGTKILFTSDRENENSDVYIMNADGGNTVKFTNWDKTNETAGPGSWSPDGTQIAFFSDRNGKDDIYVASAETIRPRIVLSEPQNDLHAPNLSADGKRIVYSRESADKTGELRVLDLETHRTQLIRKTELPVTWPTWSPDGRIAFYDRIDGNSEVCVINPDGSGYANITNDKAIDTGPAWSPDGTRLIYIRTDRFGARLHTIMPDGSDLRPVTPRGGWEGDPEWSPTGEIIFVCDRADSPGNLLDICEIHPDGSSERRVLSHRNYDSQPSLSPDGTRVAFVSISDGNAEIYLMNRDGSGLQRLTHHPADDMSPDWSPDGRRLIFTSNRNGKMAIYEVEL